MKKIFALLLSLSIIVSCSSDNKSNKDANTFVSGTIKDGLGVMIYIEELTATSITKLDSITLTSGGDYNFGIDVKNRGFYRIRAKDDNSIVLILSKGEKVTIDASANNLQATYTVSGSEETSRLKKLNEKEYQLYLTNDSLKRELLKHQQTRDVNNYVTAMNAQTKLLDDRTIFIKAFIDEKPGSLASLAAVERLDKEQDLDYYKKVADHLKEIIPESDYYQNLQQRLDEWGRLAIGGEAPEIVLNDPNGNPIALSSLKGKVVLIDFWASWCRPCRAENPNVVKMYNKYADKGFEIFSVSLDKTHEAWVAAIQQDGLVWKNHVSDLKFWQSAAVKLYDVKGIPLTYLIDKDGKIIGKNLRGESLEAKLKEIFGA